MSEPVKTRKFIVLISMFFCFQSIVVDLFFFLNFKKSFILNNKTLCDYVPTYRFFFFLIPFHQCLADCESGGLCSVVMGNAFLFFSCFPFTLSSEL